MKRAIAAEVAKITLWTAFLCLIVTLASTLGILTSAAADAEWQTGDSSAAQWQTGDAPAARAPGTLSVPARSDLETRLRDARARLARDAREVAELSMQLGAGAMGQGMVFRAPGPGPGGPGPGPVFFERFGHGVVGLQLDTKSGTSGARVDEVSPGGPADEAGIRPGDIIVAVNGAPISGRDTARQALERLRGVAPNTSVSLSVARDGKTRRLELTTRPAFFYSYQVGGPAGGPMPPMPPMPPGSQGGPGQVVAVSRFRQLPDFQAMSAETAGMVLASLTPGLGAYFGTSSGVLVLRAPSDDVFRLEDGDVIVSIGGREPRNGFHATEILGTYMPGERLVLAIVRHKKPMTLTLTLPKAAPR
jgi:membrane-associated protease RseP (regulator of RpoE activity)